MHSQCFISAGMENSFIPGDRALKAVHNANLKQLSFPMYESEGFGLLNFMVNIELRNNFVLSETILISMQKHCRFCTIQPYRGKQPECMQAGVSQRFVQNATRSSLVTSATPRNSSSCVAERRLWDLLWTTSLCWTSRRLRRSSSTSCSRTSSPSRCALKCSGHGSPTFACRTWSSSRPVKLVRFRRTIGTPSLRWPTVSGQPAFLIEGNLKLTEIQVSKEFKWSTSQEAFHIILAPSLKIYPSLSQCKYCVLELTTSRSLSKFCFSFRLPYMEFLGRQDKVRV